MERIDTNERIRRAEEAVGASIRHLLNLRAPRKFEPFALRIRADVPFVLSVFIRAYPRHQRLKSSWVGSASNAHCGSHVCCARSVETSSRRTGMTTFVCRTAA